MFQRRTGPSRGSGVFFRFPQLENSFPTPTPESLGSLRLLLRLFTQFCAARNLIGRKTRMAIQVTRTVCWSGEYGRDRKYDVKMGRECPPQRNRQAVPDAANKNCSPATPPRRDMLEALPALLPTFQWSRGCSKKPKAVRRKIHT